MRRLIAVLLIAWLGCVANARAAAVQGVTHRFTVWGRVTRPDGRPVANQRVLIIVAKGFSFAAVRTGRDGWYRRVLNVDNADLGKVFDVRAGHHVVQVRVAFNPADTHTERGKRVDFVLAK